MRKGLEGEERRPQKGNVAREEGSFAADVELDPFEPRKLSRTFLVFFGGEGSARPGRRLTAGTAGEAAAPSALAPVKVAVPVAG